MDKTLNKTFGIIDWVPEDTIIVPKYLVILSNFFSISIISSACRQKTSISNKSFTASLYQIAISSFNHSKVSLESVLGSISRNILPLIFS
jgi:hypothetical protein